MTFQDAAMSAGDAAGVGLDLAPLYVLSGAPGAGKTTVLPELVRLAHQGASPGNDERGGGDGGGGGGLARGGGGGLARGGGLVVADIDEVLEGGALLGVPIATEDAEADWPAYDRLWTRILALSRRAGHAALVLGPWTPSDPGAAGDASGWAVLDCADDARVERLRARGWSGEQIRYALEDAAQYRAAIPTVFRSDVDPPGVVAARVLGWAYSLGSDERAEP